VRGKTLEKNGKNVDFIECVLFNARSIKGLAKRFELCRLLSCERFKLLAITETWANDSLSDSMLVSDVCSSKKYPYTVFRKDRENKEGGGVCILVHNSLSVCPVKLPDKFKSVEIVVLDIVSSDNKQRFACVYRPENEDKDVEAHDAKLLSECLTVICDVACPVSLVGDFNLRDVDWKTYACKNNSIDDVLLDCFLGNSMHQFVEEPTRFANLLDLVFCTDVNNVCGVKVTDAFGLSDHRSVEFKLVLSARDTDLRNVRDWKNADHRGIAEFLSQQNWDEIFLNCADIGEARVNDYYSAFLSVIDACIHVYVPMRKLKKGFARKLPRKLRRMRAEKNRLYKIRNNSEEGRRLFKESSDKFVSAVKSYAEKLENKCLAEGDVKNFYAFANSKLKSRRGVSPLKTANGTSTTVDEGEKCEILNKFFCSVFTVDDNTKPTFDRVVPENVSLKNVVFSASKVCKALRKLPNKSSGSPDNVPALFLKNIVKYAVTCKDHFHSDVCLCTVLSRVFTVSFNLGFLPMIWLKADVVPIFKKGDVSEPSNYRPVSLTCICCKLMETLLKDEMLGYLRSHSLITKEQHGFLSRKSVETQILECLNDWTGWRKDRKCGDVIYLDFRKAFDSVSHSKLMVKLEGYGLQGPLLGWLKAFLSGRSQRVVINEVSSDSSCVISGVPQGSVLGPLLFLLYINDICSVVPEEASVKIFADDVKLYAKVKKENLLSMFHILFEKNILQETLDRVLYWAKKWQLSLAVSKCAVLSVGHNNPKVAYYMENEELEHVSIFRDLGIMVNEDLKVAAHCQTVAAKAMRVTGLMFRAFSTKNQSVLVNAYVTYVRPLLESCTVVWSPYLLRDICCIERVQRFFTRRVYFRCRLGQDNSYEERCRMLGLESLEMRRLRQDMTMCYKILSGAVEMKANDFFKLNTGITRGHSKKLFVEHCSINSRKFFFNNRVVEVWNSLGEDLVISRTVAQFVNKLSPNDLKCFCKVFDF